jgi:hypothetical protein
MHHLGHRNFNIRCKLAGLLYVTVRLHAGIGCICDRVRITIFVIQNMHLARKIASLVVIEVMI